VAWLFLWKSNFEHKSQDITSKEDQYVLALYRDLFVYIEILLSLSYLLKATLSIAQTLKTRLT